MATKKPATPSEPVVVRNIEELLKGIPKGKLLVHFTQEQWSGFTKGMKLGTTPPKQGAVLAFTPFPNGGGGIGSGDCLSGPCEICSERWGRSPDDGSIGLQCRCRRDPACPPNGGTRLGHCRLVFRLAPIRQLECVSVDCTGTCRLTGTRLPDGRILIGCGCQ